MDYEERVDPLLRTFDVPLPWQMLQLYCGCEVLGYVKSVQDVGTDDVDVESFTREQASCATSQGHGVRVLSGLLCWCHDLKQGQPA